MRTAGARSTWCRDRHLILREKEAEAVPADGAC
jgi:hypothetical protein